MHILTNILFLLILVILVVGGILLQIFLSKRKNKCFGLILPLICLLFSIISVLSIPMYTSNELTIQQLAPNGTVIEESIIEQHKEPAVNTASAIFQILVVFIIYNIPNAILLVVYFSCRENIKKNSQLEKMNIQDLE